MNKNKDGFARASLRIGAVRQILELGLAVLFITLGVQFFFAEAFVVPSGSMAPTLLGLHKEATCPACGYAVVVGRLGAGNEGDAEEARDAAKHYGRACCPNCGCWDLLLSDVPECQGDRLLVHKNVFQLREPQLWETVVFNRPTAETRASQVFVKRVVGLPGQTLQLRHGEVFINDHIARKDWATLRSLKRVIHDDRYRPADAPTPFRWRAGPGMAEPSPGVFELNDSTDGMDRGWLTYRHLVRDRGAAVPNVWHEVPTAPADAYNGATVPGFPCGDPLLDLSVIPLAPGWLCFSLSDGFDDILLELPVGRCNVSAYVRLPGSSATLAAWPRLALSLTANAAEEAPDPVGGGLECDAASHRARLDGPALDLPIGQPAAVTVALVDRRLHLVVNGQALCGPGLDLPAVDPAAPRRYDARRLKFGGMAPVSVGVRGGGRVWVRGLVLAADVHYAGQPDEGVARHGIAAPVRLGPGEYFVLGDNTTNSYDSRYWPQGPVVRAEWLLGKPCLLHLPTKPCIWQVFGGRQALAIPDWRRMSILR